MNCNPNTVGYSFSTRFFLYTKNFKNALFECTRILYVVLKRSFLPQNCIANWSLEMRARYTIRSLSDFTLMPLTQVAHIVYIILLRSNKYISQSVNRKNTFRVVYFLIYYTYICTSIYMVHTRIVSVYLRIVHFIIYTSISLEH